jgi:hypothetical protein
MSVTELQKRITRLSPLRRKALAKYALYLERLDSPTRRRALTRSMREMDAGIKYSHKEVLAILASNPATKE